MRKGKLREDITQIDKSHQKYENWNTQNFSTRRNINIRLPIYRFQDKPAPKYLAKPAKMFPENSVPMSPVR
jgi:hypothetical protein